MIFFLPASGVTGGGSRCDRRGGGSDRAAEPQGRIQIHVFNTDNASAVSPAGLAIDPLGNVYRWYRRIREQLAGKCGAST
jgi:hypothetical protein